MFGLFKKKPNREDFETAKDDGTVYPKGSITLLQIETESGAQATAWINKGYKGYPFKEFCPCFYKIGIDLQNRQGKDDDQLDMSTIEDYFEGELRSKGVSHFIARFITDKGMDLLFYTEHESSIHDHVVSLISTNELGLELDVSLHENDSKWRSMAMVLR